MTRVGFIFDFEDKGWLGGVNYFRNLLEAVLAQPDRKVAPVLLVPDARQVPCRSPFVGLDVVESPLLRRRSGEWWARKAFQRLSGRDALLDALLRRHRVDVLSHSGHIGTRPVTPAVGWLPDFQHLRLPEFFPPAERARRDKDYLRVAKLCDRVILSSQDALNDFAAFAPDHAHKGRILRFAATADAGARPTPAGILASKYRIEGPYFFLPNQFWAHKNHAVVIEALGLLRKTAPEVIVIATGNTNDFRQPGHFGMLQERVLQLGVADSFRVLGMVPYADILGLMRGSVALVNPSLFEGWSTSVEEARSLGKAQILSDISVHREQAGDRSLFFAPHDPAALAGHFMALLAGHDDEKERQASLRARAALDGRIRAFALAYEAIVLAPRAPAP